MAEETIETQESVYRDLQKKNPDFNIHDLLANVWLLRRANFGIDPYDPNEREMAYAITV
jgi:hypothetical protein